MELWFSVQYRHGDDIKYLLSLFFSSCVFIFLFLPISSSSPRLFFYLIFNILTHYSGFQMAARLSSGLLIQNTTDWSLMICNLMFGRQEKLVRNSDIFRLYFLQKPSPALMWKSRKIFCVWYRYFISLGI